MLTALALSVGTGALPVSCTAVAAEVRRRLGKPTWAVRAVWLHRLHASRLMVARLVAWRILIYTDQRDENEHSTVHLLKCRSHTEAASH